jgi:hypothetical protein
MQPSKPVALGALVVVLIGFAVVVTRAQRSKPPQPAPSAPASASASAPAPSAAAPAASASAAESGQPALSAGELAGEGFDMLPDGRRVPPLPESAPQTVSFGVIQVAYQGAQFAPPNARPKEQARQRALALVAEAKRDFSAAVAKGDPGSAADKGRIPRGMLEPAPEYLLFTLPKGEVHAEPVDTPRGYWVIRRIN